MNDPVLHRIAVAGASGRMGQMLIEAVRAAPDTVLGGALDRIGSPALGADAAAFLGQTSEVTITADLLQGLTHVDTLIDFTRPEGTLAHLRVCRELGINAVIGTTGFSEAQKAEIAEAARDIAIVMAPNMSVGVNVTLKLLEMAARALSTGYDIEIIEAHHRHKVDAPIGHLRIGPQPQLGVGVGLCRLTQLLSQALGCDRLVGQKNLASPVDHQRQRTGRLRRLRGGTLGQVQLDGTGQQRRRQDENHHQHQHDIHQRRDIDLADGLCASRALQAAK